jgi:hypothetical protein
MQGENWQFFSSLAAMVAAVAAAYAVYQSGRIHEDQREDNRTQNRGDYYDTWIKKPTIEAVMNFKNAVLAHLGQCQVELQRLAQAQAGQAILDSQVKALTDRINAEYFRLADAVTVGFQAWNDPSLRMALREAIELLQDELNPEIAALALDPSRTNARRVVVGHAARLFRIVMENDPRVTVIPAPARQGW